MEEDVVWSREDAAAHGAQSALVGLVAPALRGVAVDVVSGAVVLHLLVTHLDEEVQEDLEEIVGDAETSLVSDHGVLLDVAAEVTVDDGSARWGGIDHRLVLLAAGGVPDLGRGDGRGDGDGHVDSGLRRNPEVAWADAVVLAATRALLGVVTPVLRGVTVGVEDDRVVVHFAVTRLDEEVRAVLDGVASRVSEHLLPAAP